MTYGVCIISNYLADQQQSMLRYADHLEEMLLQRSIPVKRLFPKIHLGKNRKGLQGKFSGYVDKYILFTKELRDECRRMAQDSIPWIVHIVDHSNALYVPWIPALPTLVTCHDVGAIKGARGELPDCPATFLGKQLQKTILNGLIQADLRVCVSEYTRQDFLRFVPETLQESVCQSTHVVLNPIRPESKNIFTNPQSHLLKEIFPLEKIPRYLLNVGSNLRRKNREVVIETFRQWKKNPEDKLVFAGEKLSEPLLRQIQQLGIMADVIDLGSVSNDLLAQLYQNAFAFLFPTRFEGFGWPVIEAMACGCPVLTSNNSALPEVCGDAAMLSDSENITAFCHFLHSLEDSSTRRSWIEKGFKNVQRFESSSFEKTYLELYSSLLMKNSNLC